MKNWYRSENGFSIIATLMTAVILVAVAAGLIAVVVTMFRSGARSDAEYAADQAMALTEMITANKDLCNNALRTTAGTPVPYTPVNGQVVIGQINLQNTLGGSASWSTLTAGQLLTPKLKLNSISFIQSSVGAAMTINGTQYTPYTGSLAFNFGTTTGTDFIGGTLSARKIPLTVLVGSSSGTIDICYQNMSVQQICLQMGGQIDSTTGQCSKTVFDKMIALPTCTSANASPNCPALAPGQAAFYAVTGFDSTGKPQCTCQVVPVSTSGAPLK